MAGEERERSEAERRKMDAGEKEFLLLARRIFARLHPQGIEISAKS
jgi:hypothetical protein